MNAPPRIFLSPPHMTGREAELVNEAIASNWIAPTGPHLDEFERQFAARVGLPYAVGLASGTSAIHLALRILGVGFGDEVLVSTLTFCASANPIVYQGAAPAFLDSDFSTWNLDLDLAEEELAACARRGRLPKAIVAVDLFGQAADVRELRRIADRYGVAVLEDAAESLGSTLHGESAGRFATAAAFSFNGNKIITTSGGGMLCSHDENLIRQARYLSTQARDPAPHYQHSTIGYNYRLSNVLAAIGLGQLESLDRFVAARRRNCERYREQLDGLPGIEFMPEAPTGRANRWLTAITIDRDRFGASREEVRLALEAANIESRPVWKPLHLQPAFSGCRRRGGRVAESLFERGLCLPSGSALTDEDITRVAGVIRNVARVRRHAA